MKTKIIDIMKKIAMLVGAFLVFSLLIGFTGQSGIKAKADDYQFVEQPESYEIPLESTDVWYTVNCKVNFPAYGIEVWAGNKRLAYNNYWRGTETPTVNIPIADPKSDPRELKLRVFYNESYDGNDAEASANNTEYIESKAFTVTKNYSFIEQPESYTIPLNSLDLVYTMGCKLNFNAKRIELIYNGEVVRIADGRVYSSSVTPAIEVGADPIENPRVYSIRAVYADFDNVTGEQIYEYIESEPFTVTKEYGFLEAPESYEMPYEELGTGCSVGCEVNFPADRIELWCGDEMETYAVSWLYSKYTPSVNKYKIDPDYNPKEYKIRVVRSYYDIVTKSYAEYYIESDNITLTKKYGFITEPVSYEMPEDDTLYGYDISCKVNFKTKGIELWSGNERIYFTYYRDAGITNTPSVRYSPVDSKDAPRDLRIRVYYSDNYFVNSDENNDEYIESDVFTVTKNYKFIEQPTSQVIGADSEDTYCDVSWETSFMPVRIEMYAGDDVIETLYGVNMTYSTVVYQKSIQSRSYLADPDSTPRKRKVRAYWVWDLEHPEKCKYVESDEFTVTKKYAFMVQPQSVALTEDSEETEGEISWKTNFWPVNIEVYSDGECIRQLFRYKSSFNPEQTINIDADSDAAPLNKFIRAYITEDNSLYVDSEIFTVTKHNMPIAGNKRFIKQPTSKKVGDNSVGTSCDVEYETNFYAQKVELLSNGEVVQTLFESSYGSLSSKGYFTIDADPDNDPEKVNEYRFRFYYSDTEYIDSEPFSVTKTYKILGQPESKKVNDNSVGTTCDVNYETNFYGQKWELILDGKVVKTLFEGAYGNLSSKSYATIDADPDNDPTKVKEYRYRFYYNETDYVDSDPFTVTKTYKILGQPESKKVSDNSTGTTCDINYETNFYSQKWELISDGKVIKTLFEGTYGNLSSKSYGTIDADPDNDPTKVRYYRYRFYYNDTDYVDSDTFTVTKTYKFLTQPESQRVSDTSTNRTCDVSYEVNFYGCKVELYSNGKLSETLCGGTNQSVSSRSYFTIAADADNDPETVENKKFRFYYTEKDYIESDEFIVTKTYSFVSQPKSQKVDATSTYRTCDIAYKTNFYGCKAELLSNGKVVETLYEGSGSVSCDSYYTIMADADNDPEKVGEKQYRIYYTDTDYIESAKFTVTKTYKFTAQPESQKIDDDIVSNTCDIAFKTNFYGCKAELLSNGKVIETLYEGSGSVSCDDYYTIVADDDTDPDKVEEKQYRFYYTDTDYIDSAKFTVTKTYKFKTQPENIELPVDSVNDYGVDSWETNFYPVKVEILCDDEVISTITTYLGNKMSQNITATPDFLTQKYVARVYYNKDKYIDSASFSVTKHYTSFVIVPAVDATCTKPGNETYYAFLYNGVTYMFKDAEGTVMITEIPVIPVDTDAHVWGDVTYTWTEDHSKVTAERVCTLEKTHIETETVNTTKTTVTKDGKKWEVYTAVFENAAFETQVYEEEIINQEVKRLGDIDGDGEIGPKDVTMLRRHLAGGWSVVIIEANADLDGDGTIGPKDVTILRRYLAGGWGIKLD